MVQQRFKGEKLRRRSPVHIQYVANNCYAICYASCSCIDKLLMRCNAYDKGATRSSGRSYALHDRVPHPTGYSEGDGLGITVHNKSPIDFCAFEVDVPHGPDRMLCSSHRFYTQHHPFHTHTSLRRGVSKSPHPLLRVPLLNHGILPADRLPSERVCELEQVCLSWVICHVQKDGPLDGR